MEERKFSFCESVLLITKKIKQGFHLLIVYKKNKIVIKTTFVMADNVEFQYIDRKKLKVFSWKKNLFPTHFC